MKSILIFIFLIGLNAFSFSQVTNEEFNFLLFSLDYSSNTSTFGISVPETKQPNLISGVTFASAKNIDLSYTNILTDNADSSLTSPTIEHDVMAGYNINISDDFIIYPAYTHLFHDNNSFALKSAFTDILQTDFMLYKENYNGSLSLNYMFGSKNMLYISFQNALELNIENFLIKESDLNFQLGFILNFSDKNYYNKSIYDSWDYLELLQWVYNTYPRLYTTVAGSIRDNGLLVTKESLYNSINNYDPDIFGSKYDLTSIDFYLPVFYSIKNFMLNFTVDINLPIANSTFYETETSILFSTGISYSFIFK